MTEVDFDNTKFKPHLIIRLIPAAYKREWLPDDCTDEQSAIDYAISRAKHWNRKVCLAWSEKLTVWIDEQGGYFRKIAKEGESDLPAMRIKGKKKRFVIGDKGFETTR